MPLVSKFLLKKRDIFAFSINLVAFFFSVLDFALYNLKSYLISAKVIYALIVFLIIPNSKRLEKLLKTAAASKPNMSHELFFSIVLYLAYSIAFNQAFGLTKFGPNKYSVINFRTVNNF